jgi:chromosome segregation ATPase
MGQPARQQDVGSQVLEELERGHAALIAPLQLATQQSERAILQIGEQLNTMVEGALRYVEDTRGLVERLRDGSGVGLVERIRQHRSGLVAFEAEFVQLVGVQASLAEEALEQCLRLQLVSRSISEIAMAGTILVLQVRIEAAQLQGLSIDLSSIAESLSLLNDQVSLVSERVDNLVHTLRRTLPAIIEQTHQLRQVSRKYTGELERHSRAVEAGTQALGSRLDRALEGASTQLQNILQRSQAALSELQFQDPMIQKLQFIDTMIAQTRNRCAEALGEPADAGPLVFQTNLGDRLPGAPPSDDEDGAEAGELMLF